MKKISAILFFVTLITGIIVNACHETDDFYMINQTNCTLCNECIPVCGYHAIYTITSETEPDRLYIDPNKCMGCGECVKACKYNAIENE